MKDIVVMSAVNVAVVCVIVGVLQPAVRGWFADLFRSIWKRSSSAAPVGGSFVLVVVGSFLGAWTSANVPGCSLPNPLPSPDKPAPIVPSPKSPSEAIGRIAFGNSGCTATIIGPIRDGDTEIDILTAAHCVSLGQTGKMRLKDGREFSVRCVVREAKSDTAWLKATRPAGVIPWCFLATDAPEPGERVWHQGYGVDQPGNREDGVFLGTGSEQWKYRLSVSPGDSGGGILLDKNNRVLSPVCCTTRLAGTGTVWGASPIVAAAIRPKGQGSPQVSDNGAEEIKLLPVMPLPSVGWPEP